MAKYLLSAKIDINNQKTSLNKSILYLLLLITSIQADWTQANTEAPEFIAGARTIGTETAKLLLDKEYYFIDVRGREDFNAGHIPGAFHLPVKSDFNEQNLIAIAEKAQPLVIYCNGISCLGSSAATTKAVEWGWINIFYYREGIPGWRQHGYPLHTSTP
ncbi:rhodanese-like domain-containing protein [Nitrosomonas sp.]|uniref:rhodanese-like domain-containing protein n=1 Tax=Nitrosomonas sp. TaxID=42353 RepID=UPI001E12D8AA|nr:rhodanese-like domain-containing protein [Nitrosomonas sp.]MBX3617462.1 rhodanese-like domain-containing protein [Nitrosomonas sp.]